MSYAWFTLTLTGTKQNVIKVGKLSLILDESMSEGIHVDAALPTTTEVALEQEPYHFSIENNGTIPAEYKLTFRRTGGNLNNSIFNYALKRDDQIIKIDQISNLMSTSSDSGVLSLGFLEPREKVDFKLYIWVKADYTKSGDDNSYYEASIELEGNQTKTQKLSQYVMHACDGVDNCLNVVNDITYFQQEYFSNDDLIKYIWYSGKLWMAMSYDNTGRVKVISERPLARIPWGSTADYKESYVEKWLGEEFLPTLHNYENLLETDYHWDYTKRAFSSDTGYFTEPMGETISVTSPVGLLNSMEFYLGSNLDKNINSGDAITWDRGTYYLGNTNEYGHVMVGGQAGMNQITPDNSGFLGVSPSVVFQTDAVVLSGTGTKKDPYILKGDEKGKPNEFLNTRYSGEYVAFGNGLNSSYRISKIEGEKTKVVSTDILRKIVVYSEGENWIPWTGAPIDESGEETRDSIKYAQGTGTMLHYEANDNENYPLGYYLNHQFLNPINGYFTKENLSMIEQNQTWYTGTVKGGESYTKAKNPEKGVTATVGLPTVEEPFSIMQGSDGTEETPLLTNNGTALYNNVFSNYGIVTTANQHYGYWRPSFYLKSNVKIKSGSGTKSDPYILQS